MNKFQKVASKIAKKESKLGYNGKFYNEFKSSYSIGFKKCNYSIKNALKFKNEHIKYLEYKYE